MTNGWQNTVAAYNLANPDNQLKPVAITSIDRFANACAHKVTCSKIITDLGQNGIIILDEVHKYKNPTSKRAKQLQKMSAFKKIGLSATPMTNDVVMDSISYLIIGNYYKNKSQFMNQSNLKEYVGRHGKLLIYDLETGMIDSHIWPYYHVMKSQLTKMIYKPNIDLTDLDIPELKSTIIQLDANDKLQADLRSLAWAHKSRMFDSFVDFFMEIVLRVHYDKQRQDKLIEIIKGENVKQPLIFYQHVDVKNAIIEALENAGITDYGIIAGDEDRQPMNNNSPILLQYQAGSEAIEMKGSNTTIFYENQYSYSNLVQARGRNVRRGMKGTTNHYYLVSDTSVEQALFNKISQKEEVSQKLLEEIVIDALFK